MPQTLYRSPFQIDHIIARQHGGRTSPDNLALSCFHCNTHKGPNIARIDCIDDTLNKQYLREAVPVRISARTMSSHRIRIDGSKKRLF